MPGREQEIQQKLQSQRALMNCPKPFPKPSKPPQLICQISIRRPALSRPGRQATVVFQPLATALGWDTSLGFCIEFALRSTGLRLRVRLAPPRRGISIKIRILHSGHGMQGTAKHLERPKPLEGSYAAMPANNEYVGICAPSQRPCFEAAIPDFCSLILARCLEPQKPSNTKSSQAMRFGCLLDRSGLAIFHA